MLSRFFHREGLIVRTPEGQPREQLANISAFERYAARQGIRSVTIESRRIGVARLDPTAIVQFQNGDLLRLSFREYEQCRRYFHRLHGTYGFALRITEPRNKPPAPLGNFTRGLGVALILLWLLIFRPLHADTLKIDDGAHAYKYEGSVSGMYPARDGMPQTFYFVQGSQLQIGSGPPLPVPKDASVWVVYFTRKDGMQIGMQCYGEIPQFAAGAFKARYWCDAQPQLPVDSD